MFGFRVNFKATLMEDGYSDPQNDQTFKPIHKFAADIIGELNKGYVQIAKYATNQKILIPVSEEEVEEMTHKELSDKKIKRVGDNLFRRKTTKLYWKHPPKSESASPVKSRRQSSVVNSTCRLIAHKSINGVNAINGGIGQSPSPQKNKDKLGAAVYKEKNTVRH
jgi:hypothetical protein